MKKEILMLIIGILIGAIIATGVFLVLKGDSNGRGDRMNMDGGEMPVMDGNMTEGRPSRGDMNQNGNVTTSNNTNADSTGENILKYTNGIYLTAPYDCVVTEINIPDIQGKCTNEHYVKISSNNNLIVQFSVDETNINSISLGQTAQIQISAYENKVIEGVVTNISNTASNGKFTITVGFENDGEIMMGMTATVTI